MSGARGKIEHPWTFSLRAIANQIDRAMLRTTLTYTFLPGLSAGLEYNPVAGKISPLANWLAISETANRPALILGTSSDRIGTPSGQSFYATFSNVEPCNKPVLLALDVSGSMASSMIAGSSISAREASAAMALITAATEPEHEIIAFSAPVGGGFGGMHGGGESGITRVDLSPRMRLAEVIKRIEAIPMGGTDCALPMLWAVRNKLNVSGFITYTDSETWAGNIHPAQALRQYRSEFVSDAKAVVVGMTSNGFTLADPNDRGMLDVVGFDTSVPAIISDFVRGSRTVQGRQDKVTMQAETKVSACIPNFRPVSRVAQAAVCKTVYVGANPSRDSISSSIGVERYTPVFQTGIQGALP